MTEYYYNLHVVHDISTIEIKGKPSTEQEYKADGITGHFYTVLESNDPSLEKRTTFSYGPKMSDMPVWPGHIDQEDENRIDKFSSNTNLAKNAAHIKKSVPLTKEQYQQALAKGQAVNTEPGLYTAGYHDCMAVTQEIYKAAGQQGDFADLFTKNELATISRAANAAILFYGTGDEEPKSNSIKESIQRHFGDSNANTNPSENPHAAQAHAVESNYWRNNFPILHKMVELPLENPILSMLFWRDPTRMLSESGRLTLPSDGYGYVPFMGFSGSSMGTAGLGPNPPFGGGGGSSGGSRFGPPSSTLGISDSRFRPFSSNFNSGDSLIPRPYNSLTQSTASYTPYTYKSNSAYGSNFYQTTSTSINNFELIRSAIRNIHYSSSDLMFFSKIASDLDISRASSFSTLKIMEYRNVLASSGAFQQALVEARLVSTYNAYHGRAPVYAAMRAYSGRSIGGVATKVGIIEDLLNGTLLTLNDENILVFPREEAKSLFTESELKEICAVLYEGVFKYDTYPLFSLHFNQDGALYSIIHPIYKNSIIGDVIGYLDYYMKGYLNGGIYPKEFLEKWHENPNMNKEYLKSFLIEIKKLSKEMGIPYKSLRELLYTYGLGQHQADNENDIGGNKQKYMTSFRIIAKLEKVEKDGNILLMKSGFDVEYSVELHPEYEEYLDQYYRDHGKYPNDYMLLRSIYAMVANNIKTNMPKFAFAKELFEKLALINSMSYYFLTLKEMGKEPVIEQPEHFSQSNFPKILPPIPVRYFEKYTVSVLVEEILNKLTSLESNLAEDKKLSSFIKEYFKNNEISCPENTRTNIHNSIRLVLSEKLNNKIPDEDFINEKAEIFLNKILSLANLEETELFESNVHWILYSLLQPQEESEQLTKINTAINSLETAEEKTEYLETYVQVEYHKVLVRYQEKNTNLSQELQEMYTSQDKPVTAILAKFLLDNIEPLPSEIKSHFNAETYFSLTTFSEKVNYLQEKLEVIYNMLKSNAHFKQELVEEFHNSVNGLIAEVKNNYNEMQSFFGKVFDKLNECRHPEEIILSLLRTNEGIRNTKILDSYDHSVTDIADGSYMKEASTDLNVVGGVGLTLGKIKTSILPKSYSRSFQNTSSATTPYELKESSISNKHFTSFKIITRDKFTSSNLEYILEDSSQSNSDENKSKFSIPLDQIRHTLAYSDKSELANLINPQTVNAIDSYGYTPLMVAAQNGDTEQIKFLLSQKANIHVTLPNQLNALNIAILNGHEETALFLISNTDIDINNANINKNTVLHNAIKAGLIEVANKLVEKGANLNIARLDDGFTVAHMAANKGSSSLIKAMSKKEGFNINVQTASGKTPLHIAAKIGQLETVILLLEIGVKHSMQDTSGHTPLMDALENGQHQIAEYLADISTINATTKSKQTASIIAINNNQMNAFDKLLKRGEDPLLIDDYGHNAIYHLLVKGDFARFVALYEKLHFDVNMSFPEGSSLFVASLNKHDHIANFLAQKGAEFTSKQEGLNLLDLTVSADNISHLRTLINNESFIKKLIGWNADKYQLLKKAVKYNSKSCFDELYSQLSVGEKLTLKNDSSILLAALSSSSQYILKKILDIFPNSNIPLDSNKNNAAHICVKNGMIMHLELLYENGIKFTSKNNDGLTAFHLAILNKDKDIFKKLTSLVKQRYWPSDLFSFAIANDSLEIIEYLKTKNFISKGLIDGANSQTLLKLCKEGEAEKVNALLNNYSIEDTKIFLNGAIEHGQLIITELLINHFHNDIELNKFAYFSACKYEQIELIKYFQSKNIALTQKELLKCIGSTSNKFIRAAIQQDYDKLDAASSKLQYALEKGNIRIIKYLINEGFPINKMYINGKFGSLPFIHYLFLGNSKVAKKILAQFSHEIDFTVKDANGNNIIEKLSNRSKEKIEEKILLLTQYAPKEFSKLIDTMKNLDNVTLSKLFGNLDIQNFVKTSNDEKLKISALTNAIVNGDINAVYSVLETIEDIDQRNEDGKTALMIAVKFNQLEITKLLVKHGADASIKDIMLNQPLHLAIMANHEELAKYLMVLQHDYYVQNREGLDPLMLAAKQGMASIVDFYATSLRVTYSKEGYTAIHYAAIAGQNEMVNKLIAMGFDINLKSQKSDDTQLYGITPLDLALFSGYIDVASSLIDSGASLFSTDSNGGNALQYAAMNDKEHVTHFIKSLKEYHNKTTQSKLLFSALQSDNVFLIRDLFLHGVSLEIMDNEGFGLIHRTIIQGAKKSLNFLIEQGININSYSNSGDTPLHLAIKNGEIDILHRLLSADADIKIRDKSEKTALFTACELGNYAAVLELVKHRPNFKKQDYNSVTPSQIALANGHMEIVELLFLIGDKSLIKSTSKIIPTYIKNAMEYHKSTIAHMKDENVKAIKYEQNSLFIALNFNNLDAIKIILQIHPEFLQEQDNQSNYAVQYATEEAKIIINGNHVKAETQNKEIAIPNTKIIPNKNTINDLIKIFIDEKLSNIVEENLITSLESKLQRLNISSLTAFIFEISVFSKESLAIYIPKTISLLKSFEKLGLDAASDVFFTSYKWEDMISLQLEEIVETVFNYDNDHLTNWFYGFFNPVKYTIIDSQVLKANINLFKNFITNFNSNLSDVPVTNISFQSSGTEYLIQATNLMKCSKNKDFQAKYLDSIPTKLKLDNLCNNFKAITKHMTANGNILPYNSESSYSYLHNKANTLYLAAQVSEQSYTKMMNLFSKLDNEEFEDHEMIMLSKTFFDTNSVINDVPTFISAARTIKEKVGAYELAQLFTNYIGNTTVSNYIELSQLLSSLANKVDLGVLIKQHTNIVDLKNEIRSKYKEHLSNSNIIEDANTVNLLVQKFENVSFPLPKDKLEILKQKYILLIEKSKFYKNFSPLKLNNEAHEVSSLLIKDNSNTDASISLLSILREAFKHIIGIYPYDTQIFVVMALLEPINAYKGQLAQVLTGEGKSTINTLLAAYRILSGQKHFDIITSSESLAIRDQKKYEIYYSNFNIVSSHITGEYTNPEAFKAQIIYGTNHNFEFALLRTLIYDKKYIVDTDREASVDESDNLLIDTALNSARIARNSANNFAWIYEPVLKYVQNQLYKATPKKLKELLVKTNPKEFLHSKNDLTDEYLGALISSALAAKSKRIGVDYVVEADKKTGEKIVIIVDNENTGHLNYGSRWSNGLHEFVEILNGLQPKQDSNTIAAISHPSFFSLYSKIYGLTGTIGGIEEREEIKKIYNINYFDVPPHFKSQREAVKISYIHDQNKHNAAITTSIKKHIAKGRPVLVLFNSIKDADTFSSILMTHGLNHNVLNEMQENSDEYILQQAGLAGAITIATNTAGRGTDIILSNDAKESGGLAVIVTFLPQNMRVQDQACGRSGRQGQKGSCEIIVTSDNDFLQFVPEKRAIKLLLDDRDAQVRKISLLRIERAEIEKELFEMLQSFVNDFRKIKLLLKQIDLELSDNNYHLLIELSGGVCPKADNIMDLLYKQGATMIAHQAKGYYVDWKYYIQNVKDKFTDSIEGKWAEYFSRYSLNHHNSSSAYQEFYEQNIKQVIASPEIEFGKFLNDVMENASIYNNCDVLHGMDVKKEEVSLAGAELE